MRPKKTKRKKLTLENFVSTLTNGLQTKKIRVVQFLLQGFLLFWKYKRTNHKRNYLKKAY